MDANEAMGKLRQWLAEPPSTRVWLRLNHLLQHWPDEPTRDMAWSYVSSHLDSSWPSFWRIGWGDWDTTSPCWKLVKSTSRNIESLPGAEEFWCPPGTFQMGVEPSAGETELYSDDDEYYLDEEDEDWEENDDDRPLPMIEVTLSRGFFVQTTPTTQEQWDKFMEHNPSSFSGNPHRPVENVTWHNVILFCNHLSRAEGLEEAFDISNESGTPGSPNYSCTFKWKGLDCEGYRLPTEAEWEYACRAGSSAPRYGNIDQIAWYSTNANNQTHDVKTKKPNAWGLYDFLGNVFEWCMDPSPAPVAAAGSKLEDPLLDPHHTYHMRRGGSWRGDSSYTHAGSRLGGTGSHGDALGFRIVRTWTGETKTKEEGQE